MRKTGPSELQFDPEIEKTARANRKAAKEALLASRLEATSSGTQICQEQNFSNMEEEQEVLVHEQPPPSPPRRTLGDYGRRDNGALANQGFQPANPVSFDIKNTVLSALKENLYSGSESQCPNLHLSHFYKACDYMNMVVILLVAFLLDNTIPGSKEERGVYIWSRAEDVAA
ncbi:nucleobase-ascorbate transporter 11-like, partial [Trifolium medium]|nr:nucleobase-ascorbate transporter 11-like [Trifolium medium]